MKGRRTYWQFGYHRVKFFAVNITATISLKLDFKLVLVVIAGETSDNFV